MALTSLATDLLEEVVISLPCEHSQHGDRHQPDAPAAWWALSICPKCGHEPAPYPLCEIGKHRLCTLRVLCTRCGWSAPPGENGMRFVPLDAGPS